jgi:hypothetical protein
MKGFDMSLLKYLLIGFMFFSFNNVFAGDNLITIDSVYSGYFIDESTPLPFSPILGLKFGIPDTAFVTVEVHKIENNQRIKGNVKSKKIKTILHKKLSKGMYLINWDGTDFEGKTQNKNNHYIYYIKIERRTFTVYGDGYILMEAKTKLTSPS